MDRLNFSKSKAIAQTPLVSPLKPKRQESPLKPKRQESSESSSTNSQKSAAAVPSESEEVEEVLAPLKVMTEDTCPILRDSHDNYKALERYFGALT